MKERNKSSPIGMIIRRSDSTTNLYPRGMLIAWMGDHGGGGRSSPTTHQRKASVYFTYSPALDEGERRIKKTCYSQICHHPSSYHSFIIMKTPHTGRAEVGERFITTCSNYLSPEKEIFFHHPLLDSHFSFLSHPTHQSSRPFAHLRSVDSSSDLWGQAINWRACPFSLMSVLSSGSIAESLGPGISNEAEQCGAERRRWRSGDSGGGCRATSDRTGWTLNFLLKYKKIGVQDSQDSAI